MEVALDETPPPNPAVESGPLRSNISSDDTQAAGVLGLHAASQKLKGAAGQAGRAAGSYALGKAGQGLSAAKGGLSKGIEGARSSLTGRRRVDDH